MGARPSLTQKWEALATAIGSVGFVMTEDGRYEEVLFNTDPDDLAVDDPASRVGNTIYDVLPPAKVAQLQRVLETAVETGAPERVEYDLEVDGETRWFEGVAAPLPTENAGPSYVLWLENDITDRKQRAAALGESQKRYKSLFENNPIVIWEEDFSAVKRELDWLDDEVDDLEAYLNADPDRVLELFDLVDVVDVNQNAVTYYGADSKTELLEHLDWLFTEDTIQCLKDELLAVAAGETRFRTETTARTMGGVVRQELLEFRVPAAHADDFSQMYLTNIDISAQKSLEAELRQKNQRLDEFATIISHDLRNPLMVAKGHLELLDVDDTEHVEPITAAIDRIDDIVTGTLSLAREGDTVGDTETIWMPEFLLDCWAATATMDATLDVVDEFSVEGDPDRLRHVFENVFRNAVEHGGSDVSVRVGRLEDGFFVEDDGPGIPVDDRETVFEPGQSNDPDGYGFGLSIVRRIVEAHGAAITVTASADGGARFEFTGLSVSE